MFNQYVRPGITGTPRENPNVLFIGGAPGSGKTTAQGTLLSRLGRTDSFSLDGDELILPHPRSEQLHREEEFTGAYLASEGLKGHWWSRAARLLRMQRLDTVISAPLAGPQWAIKRITEFRRTGFQVGVAFVATHEALSLQGVVDRYHRNRRLYGYGRWIPPQWHDAAYSGPGRHRPVGHAGGLSPPRPRRRPAGSSSRGDGESPRGQAARQARPYSKRGPAAQRAGTTGPPTRMVKSKERRARRAGHRGTRHHQ
nr:zeta toxin family protein [Streptomyces sp. CB01249]